MKPSVCRNVGPVFQAQRSHRRVDLVRANLKTVDEGEQGTLEYRLAFQKGGKKVSPWHDIPLYANDEKTLVNYVNEIPKGTSAKMEIATEEANNPIKQDVKKGALRFYKYSDSLINYGALPQTWEDPGEKNEDTGCNGDNDPVDVIEISADAKPMGAVYAVKPFGILALLDEGETDWKVLAIDAADPNAEKINSVEDANDIYPGLVENVTDWFRMYKTAEGKGENEYAFGGKAKDTTFAMRIISETHESYKKLKAGSIPNETLSLN